jgi:hypothetical protein
MDSSISLGADRDTAANRIYEFLSSAQDELSWFPQAFAPGPEMTVKPACRARPPFSRQRRGLHVRPRERSAVDWRHPVEQTGSAGTARRALDRRTDGDVPRPDVDLRLRPTSRTSAFRVVWPTRRAEVGGMGTVSVGIRGGVTTEEGRRVGTAVAVHGGNDRDVNQR